MLNKGILGAWNVGEVTSSQGTSTEHERKWKVTGRSSLVDGASQQVNSRVIAPARLKIHTSYL